MIDAREFSDRWDAALKANGVTNAFVASHFGPTGQQTVNGWKERGRVGQPSVRKVKELLPRTNMEWLQDGVGPELVSSVAEPSQRYDLWQSYVGRSAASILAQALKIVDADEQLNGVYNWDRRAEILLDLCQKLEAGEDAAVLGMRLTHQRQKGGDTNGDVTGGHGGGKHGG